jgi:hypothetical protein
MSLSLTYITREPVADEVRKLIMTDTRRLRQERLWWCESIAFFPHRKYPGHLVGATKLFLLEDVEEGVVTLDDDLFMAFYDARFILWTLAGWSERHGISWNLILSGEDAGQIVGGQIKPASLFEADASPKKLQVDEERAQTIRGNLN